MLIDPYVSPRSDSNLEAVLDKSALKELIMGWEKLRLLYNVLLLVPGLVMVAVVTMNDGMPIAVGLVGALIIWVGANIAYFLGPLAELYFRALFRNGEPIGKGRQLIFGAGLVVSAGVFLLALIGALA